MNIAQHVISKCDGVKAVSEGLSEYLGEKVPAGRVYIWTYPRTRSGTGGLIPARYHLPILRWARGAGKDLRPEDFFGLDAELNPIPGVVDCEDETLACGAGAEQFNSATGMHAAPGAGDAQ